MRRKASTPYRTPAKRGMQYKVVNIFWTHDKNWSVKLEEKLTQLSEDGWRPILYSDGGNACTVICERSHQE